NKSELASFHLAFADMVLHGAGYHAAWRLQYLTDLTKLPDYEDGYPYGGLRGRGGRWGGWAGDAGAAPVGEQGNPVYHKLPRSFEKAQSDGERWRWLLERAATLDPTRRSEVDMIFANFMRGQLGEQTMAQWGLPKDSDNKTGTFALHTLGDEETIA